MECPVGISTFGLQCVLVGCYMNTSSRVCVRVVGVIWGRVCVCVCVCMAPEYLPEHLSPEASGT